MVLRRIELFAFRPRVLRSRSRDDKRNGCRSNACYFPCNRVRFFFGNFNRARTIA